ncbi:MAG: DUF4012 domain-containing protein [bacterium]|nr:DUF4012 domain-containing protein [bacterium]
MSQFSPNLKPKSLHNHSDKAGKLGVPRSNVVDLRSVTLSKQEAGKQKKKAKVAKKEVNRELSWLQRRKIEKQERLISEQRQRSVSIKRPAVAEVIAEKTNNSTDISTDEVELVAAPVPDKAKIHRPDNEQLNFENQVDASTVVVQTKQQKKADKEALLEAKQRAKEDLRAERLKFKIAKKDKSQNRTFSTGQLWQQTARSATLFVVVCIVLVSPFASMAFYKHVSTIRDEVIQVSEDAVVSLAQGGASASDLDFIQAQESFGEATTDFKVAHEQLVSVSSVLAPIVKIIPEAGGQYNSAENILIAGENISASAEDVTKAFTILTNLSANPFSSEELNSELSLTDLLVIAHSSLRPAAPRLERAAIALNEVDIEHFPEEYRADLQFAKDVVPTISRSVNQLLSLNESMLTILGHEESKRYLVLFQNNREIRASGGFIGSFAVVEIRKGQVKSIEIPGGGPYDLLNNLTANVISPQPLHYVNPHWQMQDANWWPDFAMSAQKVQWFYLKSGGSSVDGVISLTPDIIEQMLAITGPIAMPEYAGTLDDTTDGTMDEESLDEEETDTDTAEDENEEADSVDEDDVETEVADEDDVNEEEVEDETLELTDEYLITSDNFYRVTQEQAERKYDDTKESKKFIADLTPRLLSKLFALETENFLPVLQVFYNSLIEKDLLVYFNDPFIQNEMSSLGWTGELKDTSNDYLMVVDTNIAGGKTDHKISVTIEHEATIQESGKIIDKVTVTRMHDGASGDELEDVKNMDYIRFYVPEGSNLISSEGFTQPARNLLLEPEENYVLDEDLVAISGDTLIDENSSTRINNELGKTVFGNWIETSPGETSKVTIEYELPFRIDMDGILKPVDSYSLLVQKQPGSFDPLLQTSVNFPSKYSIRWSYPENSKGMLHRELTKDAYVGLVLEQ